MLSLEWVQNMYLWSHQITEVWLWNNKVRPDRVEHSDMQWPAPDWFHVPLVSDWTAIKNEWVSLWAWSSSWASNFRSYLKIPLGWRLDWVWMVNSSTYYRSAENYNSDAWYNLDCNSSITVNDYSSKSNWFSIRAFKDSPEVPDSSWTTLYSWTWWAGIFHSSSKWLISISSDWTNWITIMDKNLWATTVWNDWNTVNANNAGKLYQWGNNYWFDWNQVPSSTSTTKVNASIYWPWNYYSSSTFTYPSGSQYGWAWDTTINNNLWGWVSQWHWYS